jgi:NAD(P)-dependent dehydrogenase (short-subunit alcohol dehydrogenase family)
MGIQTPFGFTSTAADVVRGVDLAGKRVVITGGAAGIGIETARALATAGAEITLAVRRVAAASAVAAELAAGTGNPKIQVLALDVADPASVRHFASRWSGPLHILVNNAGVMAIPELQRTPQGWEMQFATNHLGHFALTVGLHRALAAAQGARVVAVSSSAHMMSPVLFDDPHFNFMPYVPFVAYGQSKTAMILMAVEAARRWAGAGIQMNALDPGAIQTGLQKYTGAMKTPPVRRKTVAQGAATSVLLAASPLLEGISGRYFENCNEAALVNQRPTDFTGGVAAYALDADNASRLWDLSMRLVA